MNRVTFQVLRALRACGRFASSVYAGIAASLSILVVVPAIAWALPGDLVVGWGENGVARVDVDAEVGDFVVLPDGSLFGAIPCTPTLSTGSLGLFRLNASGGFDDGFAGFGFARCPPGVESRGLVRVAASRDGGILFLSRIPEGGPQGITTSVAVGRYTETGAVDPGFGGGGLARSTPIVGIQQGTALVVDTQDRIVAAIRLNCENTLHCIPMLSRWRSNGTLDTTFGGQGHVLLPTSGRPEALAVHPDGRLSVVLNNLSNIQVARVLDNGDLDTSFGAGGIASLPPAGHRIDATDLVVQGDDKVVVAATQIEPFLPNQFSASAVFMVRFTDRGVLDVTFGDSGIVKPRTPFHTERPGLALQADGKVLLAAAEIVAPWPASRQLFVARFNANGAPDLHFAGAGIATLPVGWGSINVRIKVHRDGSIFVANPSRVRGQPIRVPVVYRIDGGSVPIAREFREARAIEYYHASFGHYFLTTSGIEIEHLDFVEPGGWSRTGQAFLAWAEATRDSMPVCRFFSDQAFAPRSSHFYTPYAGECGLLKSGSVWKYEGSAFHLQLPGGAAGAGRCPFGSRPLYRAYNNGLSGAPNHRYTIDPVVLDTMVAFGWTFEGEAQTRVFACVPLQ